jgi:hypothetical protein
VERHELLGKWKAWMTMAGFQPYPLSSSVNHTIKTLLESYSDKYLIERGRRSFDFGLSKSTPGCSISMALVLIY